KEIEDHEREMQRTAESQLEARRGEQAIATFEELEKQEWQDLPWMLDVGTKVQRLKLRLMKATEQLKSGREAREKGGVVEALSILEEAQREYAEFTIVNDIKKEIEK